MISPNTGVPKQPDETTLVQLGFLWPLNYPFVVSSPMSSAQIFSYLPQGIASGLNLEVDQITMHSLNPLDTSAALGYITTVALAYIPSNMVTSLSNALHSPVSGLYNTPDESVNTIMGYLNPAIPLTPGSNVSGGSGTDSGTASSPSASSSSDGNSDVFSTSDQSTSSSVSGTTAGIAVAAVGGAAAYGAAMFFIARRYKKKKQGHKRASSIQPGMAEVGSPSMIGGPVMSGARNTALGESYTDGDLRDSRGSGQSRGNSARNQQISGPMMAENSLGWN